MGKLREWSTSECNKGPHILSAGWLVRVEVPEGAIQSSGVSTNSFFFFFFFFSIHESFGLLLTD
jgi:hypothetical protein